MEPFAELGFQRFIEGEIVRLIHGGGGAAEPAYWHVRFAQEVRKGLWQYHLQAVPIGLYPATLRWVAEEEIRATGVSWPVTEFEEQDEWFARAGRLGQLQARRTSSGRKALSEERGFLTELVALA